MTEFKETPIADRILSLDTATDDQGREFLFLVLHLENDTVVRIPMSVEVGMRVWGLLESFRKDRAASAPTTPISTGQMQ